MRTTRKTFLMLTMLVGILSFTVACGKSPTGSSDYNPPPPTPSPTPLPDPGTVTLTVPAGSSLVDVKALQGSGSQKNIRFKCRNVKIILEGVPWSARFADGLAAWGLNSDPAGGDATCGTIRFVADATITGELAHVTKYGENSCTPLEATVSVNPVNFQHGDVFHLIHGVGHVAYAFGHPANGRDSTGPFVMTNIDGSVGPLVPNGTEQWFAEARWAYATCTTFNIVQ